jgi:hypothetical protein
MTDYCPPDPLTILPVYNPENWIDTCSGGGGGGGAGFQGPQGILGISGVQGIQGSGGSAGGAGTQGAQGGSGPQGVAGVGTINRYDLTSGAAKLVPSGATMVEFAFTGWFNNDNFLGFQGNLALRFQQIGNVDITSGYPGGNSTMYLVSGTGTTSNSATFNGIIRAYCTRISGSNYTYIITCTESTVTNENAFTRVNGSFTTTNGPIVGVSPGLFRGGNFVNSGNNGSLAITGV